MTQPNPVKYVLDVPPPTLDRDERCIATPPFSAEPKSGTGTSYEWAWAALAATCTHLNSLYGDASCRTDGDHVGASMIFEPGSASAFSRCSCINVERSVNVFRGFHESHRQALTHEALPHKKS